jgi:murein DD-endopeptidase MepM/ murein hydrolase activator NlpD
MFGLPVDGTHLGTSTHVRSGAGHTLANGQPCFRLTQGFWSINPAYPQFGYHRALDAANHNCGAPIRAARAGRAHTRRDIYGALIVEIVHDGIWRTTYAHLSRFAIASNVWVNQGQVIGYNGTTGLSSGCHLHFEVWKYGVRVDPWPLLSQNITKSPDTAQPPPTTVTAGGLPVTFTSRSGWRATIMANRPRRAGATLASTNYGNTTKDESLPIWGEVAGQNWGVGGRWFFGPQYIGRWRVVYIPLVDLKNRNF